MRIKDIKAGGWVRFKWDGDEELAKVKEFSYTREYVNGYAFRFEGYDCGLCFERKDFKYSNNVANLIKKGERVLGLDNHYYFANSFTKDEFVKKIGSGK